MGECILVTGPTKSGKSEWAETLAQASGQPVVYVATAAHRPEDADWQARLSIHRQRRPPAWQTLEVLEALPQTLATAKPEACWLVDSLGTWVANCLAQPDEVWAESSAELQQAIAAFPGRLIIVAEETGWGVVPAYPSGRAFRDRLGTLTRQLGAIAKVTYLVVAGFAINLNTVGHPLPTTPETPPS